MEELASIELERNFLSSVIRNDNFHLVSEIIKEEHFIKQGHKDILNAIKNLSERDRELSLVFIAEELKKINIDSLADLKLVGIEEASSDIEISAVELIEWANKRKLYELSLIIQKELKEEKSDSAKINKIIEDKTINLDVSIGSRARVYREIREQNEKIPPLPKFETKVSFIDDALGGGIEAGQLILVMGDPEAGKTTLTTQIIHNVSKNFPVMFFAFEFTVRSYVTTNLKKKKDLNEDNLYVVDDGYDLSDVIREIKIFAKKGGRFIVIDSQMRVGNSENKGTIEQIESEKFSHLAKLAHRLELIILFITQQGKEDTKGGVHTPMGSKKGGHEANQIWYIHKLKPKHDKETDLDLNANKRLFQISKNKQNGRHFKTEVSFNPILLEFRRKYSKEPEITVAEEKKEDAHIEIPEMDI